jgi:hypothetical protein
MNGRDVWNLPLIGFSINDGHPEGPPRARTKRLLCARQEGRHPGPFEFSKHGVRAADADAEDQRVSAKRRVRSVRQLGLSLAQIGAAFLLLDLRRWARFSCLDSARMFRKDVVRQLVWISRGLYSFAMSTMTESVRLAPSGAAPVAAVTLRPQRNARAAAHRSG